MLLKSRCPIGGKKQNKFEVQGCAGRCLTKYFISGAKKKNSSEKNLQMNFFHIQNGA